MLDRENQLIPKVYAIRLRGYLSDRRISRFEGFTATLLPDGETLLTGPVVDQAALHGILNRIRDMGVDLIEVRCVDDAEL